MGLIDTKKSTATSASFDQDFVDFGELVTGQGNDCFLQLQTPFNDFMDLVKYDQTTT